MMMSTNTTQYKSLQQRYQDESQFNALTKAAIQGDLQEMKRLFLEERVPFQDNITANLAAEFNHFDCLQFCYDHHNIIHNPDYTYVGTLSANFEIIKYLVMHPSHYNHPFHEHTPFVHSRSSWQNILLIKQEQLDQINWDTYELKQFIYRVQKYISYLFSNTYSELTICVENQKQLDQYRKEYASLCYSPLFGSDIVKHVIQPYI